MALLTAEQLARLRDIIRDASTAVAISTTGMQVSDAELQRLVDAGYVNPDALHNLVLDSFEFGRLMDKLPGLPQMGYQAFQNYLAKNPVELSEQERRAYDFLSSRAGQFCVGLGTRAEGDLTLAVADLDQKLAEAFRYSIQDEAGQSEARRESIGELTTRLRQMSEDWARDWGRIASTESHMAHQMGYIESTAERYGQGESMAKIPEPSACPDCKRLYLDADGKPRIEPVSWWMEQGVANYGLKRDAWRPVMGAMHPWCQCQVVRVPAGWEFDDEWDLVPIKREDEDEGESEKSIKLTVQTFQKSRKLHYKTTFRGLPISIENRRGSKRYWYDKAAGTNGETLMRYPYGYIRLTEGADGDHVDCYLGPHEDATHVYVIHQMKAPGFDTFDEDKVMLGFLTAKAAKRAYLMHYDNPRFFGTMDAIPIDRFVERVKAGKLAHGEKISKAKPAGPGEVHTWTTGPHQKQADGTWKPVGEQLDLFTRATSRVEEKDQEPVTRTHPPVKIPEQVKTALERGGYLVINSSGGKDSQALTYALATHPEIQRHRDRVVVLHADLGRGEWPGSMQHAEKIAAACGLRFEVAKRDVRVNPVTNKREPWEGDMLTHFEDRSAWPSSQGRFCTSDLKTGPLWKWMRQNLAEKGVPVVSALGIRRQEGEHDKTSGQSRWFSEEIGPSNQMGQAGGKDREAWQWNPLIDWSVDDVWSAIRESGVDRHYAYDLGMSRLSCIFCILASKADLLTSAKANPELLAEWINTENKMRQRHEARRQVFASAIAKAQVEGRLDDASGALLLRGEGKNADLLTAGGKRRGSDLVVPKRYLRPFLEFKEGWTLEHLRREALTKGWSGDDLEKLVRGHDRAFRSYAALAIRVEEFRSRAVAEADPGRRADLWERRRQAMAELGKLGKLLKGSHPFPPRRGLEPVEKSKQTTFGWENAPHSKKGALRRKAAGGGYEYQYPGFEVPERPETARGGDIAQRAANDAMAADPIASVTTVFLNVSGGGERARFVPVKGTSGLAGRNLGVQITAAEVPHDPKAIGRYARHARTEGLKLMVDSGEFPRFGAERALPTAERKLEGLSGAELERAKLVVEKLRAKARPLDFDQVFGAYERLAESLPPGTLSVVAPDKIGDAKATAKLRADYSGRLKALMDAGVQVIVPLQARTADGLGNDYVEASEALGERFAIGLPTAKKAMPMEAMLPFLVKLYGAGRFPKLHFLGGSQPVEMAEKTIQVVAAAYWSSRGLPQSRVLELVRTPREALRSVSKILTAKDVMTDEAEAELEPKVREWAGAGDDPDFDLTEAWVDYFHAHPEEYDLDIDGKDTHFREIAQALVQCDTSTVSRVVLHEQEHALSGHQQPVSGRLAEVPKRERHPGTLDRYLQAREYQMERYMPPSSGLEALFGRYAKSTFGGVAGLVGIDRQVGSMGHVGHPARTPGQNTWGAQPATDHPYGPDVRVKRRKKRTKEEVEEEKRRVEAQRDRVEFDALSYVDGYVRDKPSVQVPGRDPERGRKWLDDEKERRLKRRDMGRLTVHPQDTRPR